MVERLRIFGGMATAIASVREAMIAFISVNPGVGSKIGGMSTNTPSTPVMAALKLFASAISATATSQPRAAQTSPFSASRTMARTRLPESRRVLATTPPT
jgi:hypothetical protein